MGLRQVFPVHTNKTLLAAIIGAKHAFLSLPRQTKDKTGIKIIL